MTPRRRGTKALALLFCVGLLAAACGSDKKSTTSSSSSASETTTTVAVPTGGTLVIGAEQEPDCADWMGSCGGSSWGYWMMQVGTMPRAFDALAENGVYNYVPSNLLTGEPTLETTPKQKVTYTISDKAVWNDGQPVTSEDFKYTWEQVTTGSDIYDTTGYKDIESVDATNPKVAVVTYKTVYADWKALFGSGYGIFPSHLLKGKDRDALMKDGYTFSAGPWKIEKWVKGATITLVPNPSYWGDKPKLDKVIFKFQADTAAEFQAFKAGEVSVIYPQPQLDAVDQIKAGIPGTNKDISIETGNFESLWLNNGQAPFDDVNVRKAFAFSVDRSALVKALFGGLGVTKELNVINAPIMAKFTDQEAFAGYSKDLTKADGLLTGAGWAKGADGIWAKAGKKLGFTIKSTTGNKRRQLTEEVLQQQLKESGWAVTIENHKAGDLFGDILPKGDFQVGLYAQVLTSLAPGVCSLFCSDGIPTAANKFSGQNWTRTNVAGLDPLLKTVDSELDETKRIAAGKSADKLMAENVVSLPVDPLPNIMLWSNKVVGPLAPNGVLGPFWNLNQWGVTA